MQLKGSIIRNVILNVIRKDQLLEVSKRVLCGRVFFSILYSPYVFEKRGKSEKKFFLKAINHKQKELSQKTCHLSVVFINNFHLKAKITFYTQNSFFYE